MTPADDDPFVTLATFFDPMEATVLAGALRAAHLDAVVGDDRTVQADRLLSIAVQVRVRVPASQVRAARAAMEAIRAGDLALEGEDAVPPPPPPRRQPEPLFCPDVAALWSLPLTPVFGATLMAINAWRDPASGGLAPALAWLAGALAAVLAAVQAALGHDGARGPAIALLPVAYLFVWYFAAAQPASRRFIDRYGPGYRRAPAGRLGAVLAGTAAVAWWLSTLTG